MKPAQENKKLMKIADKSEIANSEKKTAKRKRRRQSVIKWIEREETAMGAGNSHELPSTLEEKSSKTILDEKDTSGSLKDSICPDPQKTVSKAHCHLVITAHMNQKIAELIKDYTSYFLPQCPVCFSPLKHAYIQGHTSELLQCPQCVQPTLCGSCLCPLTTDSATCTNNLCPLVSLLLTCGLVTDLKSRVFCCPVFRACPKCRSLITHESGCKFVRCHLCKHRFCFICLDDDCSKDVGKYWSLTCKRPRAKRQSFISTP